MEHIYLSHSHPIAIYACPIPCVAVDFIALNYWGKHKRIIVILLSLYNDSAT